MKKLHKNVFDKFSIATIIPPKKDHDKITKIIFSILSNRKKKQDKMFILEKIDELIEKGAQCIILGCTDFTVILKQKDSKTLLVDTVDVLAEAAVRESFLEAVD